MPYKIEKRGEKWHVVNAETGEDKGASVSEEMAKKHMAALYAHEPKGDDAGYCAARGGMHEGESLATSEKGRAAETARTPAEHRSAASYHAAENARHEKAGNKKAAKAHEVAVEAHMAAMEGENATASAKARIASDEAHRVSSNAKRKTDGLERVRRFDVAPVSGVRRMPNGWLRTEGTIARTGIQEYRRGDGSTIRELRLPEEVFRQTALDALALLPITDEHPSTMLDASNTSQLARGHLGERIEVIDNRLVKAPLLITDSGLVAKVESGRQSELSVGYWCDLEHTPGRWDGTSYGPDVEGEHFDCIQRNITPNHVAITHRARGGSELRVKLDSADAVLIGGNHAQDGQAPVTAEETNTVQIKLPSGKMVEVADAVIAAQIQAEFADAAQATKDAKDAESRSLAKVGAAEAATVKLTQELTQSRTDAAREKARADVADLKADSAAKETKAAVERAMLTARARIALEDKAREVLGGEFKVDGTSDLDIRKAIAMKLAPELRLDARPDEYVAAAYDLAVAQADKAKGTKGLAALRSAAPAPVVAAPVVEERVDSDAARAKRIKESEQAWKKPTVGVSRDN